MAGDSGEPGMEGPSGSPGSKGYPWREREYMDKQESLDYQDSVVVLR